MNCHHSFCFLRNRSTGEALGSKNHGKISSSQMVWQSKLSRLCEHLSWTGIKWGKKFFQVRIEQGWKKSDPQGSVGNWHRGAGKRQKPGYWRSTQSNNSQFNSAVIVLLLSRPSNTALWNKCCFHPYSVWEQMEFWALSNPSSRKWISYASLADGNC